MDLSFHIPMFSAVFNQLTAQQRPWGDGWRQKKFKYQKRGLQCSLKF